MQRPIVPPGEGMAVENPVGGVLTFKITSDVSSGALTALETVAAPQEGPPLHLHDEDELIYTLEGDFGARSATPSTRRRPDRSSSSLTGRRIRGRTSARNRHASSQRCCRRQQRSKRSSFGTRSFPRPSGASTRSRGSQQRRRRFGSSARRSHSPIRCRRRTAYRNSAAAASARLDTPSFA